MGLMAVELNRHLSSVFTREGDISLSMPRGVACRTHVRRCFHIDLTIFFFFLDFIREISIMNL